jgi:hypothetical protein
LQREQLWSIARMKKFCQSQTPISTSRLVLFDIHGIALVALILLALGSLRMSLREHLWIHW